MGAYRPDIVKLNVAVFPAGSITLEPGMIAPLASTPYRVICAVPGVPCVRNAGERAKTNVEAIPLNRTSACEMPPAYAVVNAFPVANGFPVPSVDAYVNNSSSRVPAGTAIVITHDNPNVPVVHPGVLVESLAGTIFALPNVPLIDRVADESPYISVCPAGTIGWS